MVRRRCSSVASQSTLRPPYVHWREEGLSTLSEEDEGWKLFRVVSTAAHLQPLSATLKTFPLTSDGFRKESNGVRGRESRRDEAGGMKLQCNALIMLAFFLRKP